MATKKTQKRRKPNSPSVRPIARSPTIGATTRNTSSALLPGTPPTNITGFLARDMLCLLLSGMNLCFGAGSPADRFELPAAAQHHTRPHDLRINASTFVSLNPKRLDKDQTNH